MTQESPQLKRLRQVAHELAAGKRASAVGHLLDLYEEGYLLQEMEKLLNLVPDDISNIPDTLLAKVRYVISMEEAKLPPESEPKDDFGLFDFDFGEELDASLENWSMAEKEEEVFSLELDVDLPKENNSDSSMPWFVQEKDAPAPEPLQEESEGFSTREYSVGGIFSESQVTTPSEDAPKPAALSSAPKPQAPNLDFGFSFDDDLDDLSVPKDAAGQQSETSPNVVASTQERHDVQRILQEEREIEQKRHVSSAPSLNTNQDPPTREVSGIEALLEPSEEDLFKLEDSPAPPPKTPSPLPPPAQANSPERPSFDFNFSFGEDSSSGVQEQPVPEEKEAPQDDFYNPFELSEASGDIPENWDQDQWGVSADVDVMPGLSEDWLDDAPAPSDEPDLHADVTAIPGLNSSKANQFYDVAYGQNKKEQDPSASGLRYSPPNAAEASRLGKSQSNIPVQEDSGPDLLGSWPNDPGYDLEPLDQFTRSEAARQKIPISPSLEESQSQASLHGYSSAGDEVSEEEFFELAASLAAEQSSSASESQSRPSYRGEPIIRTDQPTTEMPAVQRVAQSLRQTSPVGNEAPDNPFSVAASDQGFKHEEPTNPFAHSEPTGIRDSIVEKSQSSFVMEEVESVPSLKPLNQEFQEQLEHRHFAQAKAIFNEMSEQLGKESDDVLFAKQQLDQAQSDAWLDQLGDLTQVPFLKLSLSELSTRQLDHKAGFLLSQIDGFITVEDILEVCGMPKRDALEALVEMLDKNVIELRNA